MPDIKKSILYIVSALFFSSNVQAVDGTFDLGESLFDPSEKFFSKQKSPFVFELSGGYIQNYNPLLVDGLDGSLISAVGKGNLVTKQEAYWFEAKYLGLTNKYTLSDSDVAVDDSFSTFDLGINNRFFLAGNFSVDLNARHTQFDEQIGTGISKFRPNIAKADQGVISQASVSLAYGADPIYRSIVLTHAVTDRDYKDVNAYSNLFDLEQSVTSLYTNFRLSDLTQLISLIEYRRLTYGTAQTLDSDFYKILTGVEWQPGGKSKVLALIGWYKRKYDLVEDTSGINWEFAADYFPREDLALSINSQRRSTSGDNSERAFDTIEQDTELEIIYRYSEQWLWGVSYLHRTTDFESLLGSRSTQESNIGAHSRLILKNHSYVELLIGSSRIQDDEIFTDYKQTRVNLSWHYEF